jgi:hypothetical protein
VYVTYEPVPPVAVDEGSPSGAGLSLAARPNPTRGGLTIEFATPRDGSGSLVLFDLSGRRVRTLLRGPLAAGPHTVAWDGLADDGARPHAGIFFLRLETAAGKAERKVLLLQ